MAQATAPCSGEDTLSTTRSRTLRLPGFLKSECRKAAGITSRRPAMTQSRPRRAVVVCTASRLLQRDFPQKRQLVEGAAGAEDHRELRVLGHHDRQPGLLAQEHVEVLELRPAARHDH